MAIPRTFRSEGVRKASIVVAFPVGLALTLQAGLALADSGSQGGYPGHGHHSRTTSVPPGEPSIRTVSPGTTDGTTRPTTKPTTTPPTKTPTRTTTKPTTGTTAPTTTRSTAPPTTPPTTKTTPPTKPTTSAPPTKTTGPATTTPGPTARSYGVGITRQISIDAATGLGSITFSVGNSTDKVQPARDVYAFSTNQLEILAVPGCSAAPPIGTGWRDSFRCTLPSLKPGESRTWTADIRYLPATRPGGAQAGRAAPLAAPLVDESDISTFTVVVVPQGATNLRVVLGQDGPLRLSFGSNDPNVIGFTVRPGEGSGTTAAVDRRTGGAAAAGAAGGNGADGGNAGNSNGGNTPNSPTALPKTGLVPWSLSMAGGAVGLLILGTALVQLARLRARSSSTVQ